MIILVSDQTFTNISDHFQESNEQKHENYNFSKNIFLTAHKGKELVAELQDMAILCNSFVIRK